MTFVGQGTVQRRGMTFYMYGDYVLLRDGQTVCAMRNGAANMEPWVGRFAYVKGCEVPEYPVEGGPPFVEVNYCGDDLAARDAYPDCEGPNAPTPLAQGPEVYLPPGFDAYLQTIYDRLEMLLPRR